MVTNLLSYQLSQEADIDIEAIFDYTEAEYGQQKAVDYISQFSTIFSQLCQDPELGRTRNEIRNGLRSLIQNEHVIFYRILSDHIRIVRVLHGRSDIPSFLKKS